jgi:cytidylate kinase
MSEADIRANLLHRDFVDMNRQESPLRKAEDAIEIDTSHLTIEEQVLKVKALAEKIILAGSTENLVNS